MSSLLALHMHMNSAYARKECYHSEKLVSFKSKFSCPHTAVPSDTQVHLVLNVELT